MQAVGSYGLGVEFLAGDLGSAFAKTPFAQALKHHEVVVFESLGTDMGHVAAAANLDSEGGAVAIPLFADGLVLGAAMITFSEAISENPLMPELCEGIQIAAAHFIANQEFGRAGSGRASRSELDTPENLTDRQLLILKHLGLPITYSQIGRQLHVSESLVKQESGRIFRYFGVNSRRDAVREAEERNFLTGSNQADD